MSNISLTIAYDGTELHGWQKSDMGPTVEAILQETLEKIVRHPVTLQATSRTDAGVHAEGQVVNFFLEKDLELGQLQLSLNQLLPPAIAIINVECMPDSFHPTLDAKSKIYRYQVSVGTYQMPMHRLYAWHFPYRVNVAKMREASRHLLGRHDFTAFTNVQDQAPDNTVRELYRIDFYENRGLLMIEIEGNRFLYRMVRNLVGTLLHIGCGKLEGDELPLILRRRDRRFSGVTAPSHGLILHKIHF